MDNIIVIFSLSKEIARKNSVHSILSVTDTCKYFLWKMGQTIFLEF